MFHIKRTYHTAASLRGASLLEFMASLLLLAFMGGAFVLFQDRITRQAKSLLRTYYEEALQPLPSITHYKIP